MCLNERITEIFEGWFLITAETMSRLIDLLMGVK